MSSVELRVELPAYSHSFSLHIPSDASVLNIKLEISRICPGNPRAESQKLVWRGRYLTDDERVNDLWKSPDEPRIVHLAVHPSGWSTTPPSISPVPSASAPSFNSTTSTGPHPTMPPLVPPPTQNARTMFDRPGQPRFLQGTPIEYIQWKHDDAISALRYERTPQWRNTPSAHGARLPAMMFVRSRGYEWPTVLDEEFPTPIPGGVKYEYQVIDGLPYLSLSDSSSVPTAFQLHAIKILSYTFTLLSLNDVPPPSTRPSRVTSIPLNAPLDVNGILRQLGLPPVQAQQPLPVINNNNDADRVVRELREIALRPLLIPLVFLVFRTCLLFFFVAPGSKPLFGVLILAWMLFEIWHPVRNAFLRNLGRLEEQQRRNVPGAAQADGNGAAADGRQQQHGPQPQATQPPPQADGAAIPAQGGINGGSILDVLANVNLDTEQRILAGMRTDEPSFWRKSLIFLTLLITTVHPAIWNRRRTALRRREGQLRTHANLRNMADEDLGDGEEEIRRRLIRRHLRATYNSTPQWVRRYIERVVSTDWLEDVE